MMRPVLAALLMLASPAWGALALNGSTEWAESSTVEITAAPLTICAWAKATSSTVNGQVATISKNHASEQGWFSLNFRGADVGDPVAADTWDWTTLGRATTTTGYTAGTWHHACAVFYSTSSRAVFIDGGSKGTESSTSTPSGLNRTSLGTLHVASGRGAAFGGDLAEVGFWNVALTDDEVAELAKGYHPPCVRLDALRGYYASVRPVGSVGDSWWGGATNSLTMTGGVAATHPRIIGCQ